MSAEISNTYSSYGDWANDAVVYFGYLISDIDDDVFVAYIPTEPEDTIVGRWFVRKERGWLVQPEIVEAA